MRTEKHTQAHKNKKSYRNTQNTKTQNHIFTQTHETTHLQKHERKSARNSRSKLLENLFRYRVVEKNTERNCPMWPRMLSREHRIDLFLTRVVSPYRLEQCRSPQWCEEGGVTCRQWPSRSLTPRRTISPSSIFASSQCLPQLATSVKEATTTATTATTATTCSATAAAVCVCF